MSPIRSSAVLLLVICALAVPGGAALAQDEEKDEAVETDAATAEGADEDTETEAKVEKIVEERAAEEEDGEPEDADVGEASYNTENCEPANEAEELVADDADADADEGEDEDVEVTEKDMDECEPVEK